MQTPGCYSENQAAWSPPIMKNRCHKSYVHLHFFKNFLYPYLCKLSTPSLLGHHLIVQLIQFI